MTTKKRVVPPTDVNTDEDVQLQDYTLQFDIHQALQVAFLSCIRIANYALIDRDPNVTQTIKNAFEAYHFARGIIRHFEIRGYEAVPKDGWLNEAYYSFELSDVYYYLTPRARDIYDELGVVLKW